MRHLTGGGDAVVLFPTGAGKSICYQVPALARPGVGIVVSPLIALMRDQVEALRQAGVNAATLNSSISAEDSAKTFRDLKSGALELLYVSPERLVLPGFKQMMQGVPIALFASRPPACGSPPETRTARTCPSACDRPLHSNGSTPSRTERWGKARCRPTG